jgi:hypothetical protein
MREAHQPPYVGQAVGYLGIDLVFQVVFGGLLARLCHGVTPEEGGQG